MFARYLFCNLFPYGPKRGTTFRLEPQHSPIETLMKAEPSYPEDFLELVECAKRGRLKVYIRSATGAGKTQRMLEEAHALKKRGRDVVLAFIETHHRAEIRALIEGLEVITPRRMEYRGIAVEEMDLDAVLARRPQVAIVDELAHTNAPGCKNTKRYQDVIDFLETGVSVMCALNIQHLESLNDLLTEATGVTVRETVPDSFLRRADQLVGMDPAVGDLLNRLPSGQEKIPWARSLSAKIPVGEVGRRRVADERVMVCLPLVSFDKGAALLRKGARIAGWLNTDWFVVHVETPQETTHPTDAQAERHLSNCEEKARELGAEVARLRDKDPVSGLLDFVRAHGVGHIVLGHSDQAWWRRLLTRSTLHRLARKVAGFDLHIVSFEDQEKQS